MARMLDALPKRENHGAGRTEKYPFDEWLDGNPWLLVEGEDYECKVESFSSSLRSAAARRGLKLSIRTHPEGVAVQVTGKVEDGELAEAEAEAVAA